MNKRAERMFTALKKLREDYERESPRDAARVECVIDILDEEAAARLFDILTEA